MNYGNERTIFGVPEEVELTEYVFWWHSGTRVAALVFLANALALTWLLLFGAMPRETLAWFVAGVFWALALILGVVRWPA